MYTVILTICNCYASAFKSIKDAYVFCCDSKVKYKINCTQTIAVPLNEILTKSMIEKEAKQNSLGSNYGNYLFYSSSLMFYVQLSSLHILSAVFICTKVKQKKSCHIYKIYVIFISPYVHHKTNHLPKTYCPVKIIHLNSFVNVGIYISRGFHFPLWTIC